MGFLKNLFNIEPSTVDGKINKLLSEKGSGVFLNSSSAFQVVKEVFKILNIDIYKVSYSYFEEVANLGNAIFIRFNIMKMNELDIVPIVKNRVNEIFLKRIDDENALKIIYIFRMPKIVKGFDLSKQEHKILFEHATNINIIKKLDKVLLKNIINSKMEYENYFSFENENEYFVFVINYKKNADMPYIDDDKYMEIEKTDIQWSDNDCYFKAFSKAYDLAGNGSYIGAISILVNAIKDNPVAIMGRFEIVNSLVVIKELDIAKRILLDMSDYLVTSEHIALFYRRLGYIYIEKKIYEAAYCCMRLSLKFEESDIAFQELNYIKEKSKINFDDLYIEYVYDKYDIPKLIVKNKKVLLNELSNVGYHLEYESGYTEDYPQYFIDAYNEIVDYIEDVFPDRNVKNELLPLLMIMSDLVAIEAELDREEVFETQFKICEKLYSGSNCTAFINDRMNKYGEVIRSNKCRSEWNYNQLKNKGAFDTAIIAFGDFICNPSCIEDYLGAPIKGMNFLQRAEFANIMLKVVYPTISEFCKSVEKNF